MKTDPAVMLLNEIEILLAQIHLMELHLKRAQAVADNNMARLQEHYEAELATLRSALSAKNERLQSQSDAITAEAERRAASEVREARARFDSELANLRSALEARDQEFRNLQVVGLETERNLKSHISRAQDELEQQRMLLASREEELRASYNKNAALEQQITDLETAAQSISAEADELESLRRAHEEEIAELRHQTAVQERALTERQEAVTAVELALHGKIQALNQELARSRQEVEERDLAIDSAKAEQGTLRVKIAELVSAATQADTQARELEKERENQLSAAQTRAREEEGMFKSKIDELQIQLRDKQLVADSRAAEIASLKAAVSELSAQVAQHRDEMSALEESHNVALLALEQQLGAERQTVSNLSNQVLEIQEQHRTAEMRLQQLQSLEKRENAVEDDDEAKKRLEAELAAVRSELQQKAWALAQQQASLDNLALAHKSQIDKLESKIEEKQRDINSRESEIQGARAQIQALEQRLEDFQAELRRFTETRQLADQHASKIEELSKDLAHCGETLKQRKAEAQLVQSLRAEVQRLISEAQEKNQILQNRNDEVVRVKSELDRLYDRVNQIESARSESESTLSGEAEHMRAEFQAQLALLQAELSQKEWALEERQASAHGLEQDFRREIDALRRQLAAREPAKEKNARNLAQGQAPSDHMDGQHLPLSENGGSFAMQTSHFGYHRRWHTGLGWKRRWRS